ncbi:MAG: hypothetical protein M1827_003701 [Pycnora praestabilis]|nr:MAG: hypothetical protein M1827_003701 [Pycnora praestabilis]
MQEPDIANLIREDENGKMDVNAAGIAVTVLEKSRLAYIRQDYGWMKHLRVNDAPKYFICRWIHVFSNYPQHIAGVMLGSSDDLRSAVRSVRQIDQCIAQNERFSKHGKYFYPFFHTLGLEHDSGKRSLTPLLMSLPFLDLTINPGPPPAPRFQIDPQIAFQSV